MRKERKMANNEIQKADNKQVVKDTPNFDEFLAEKLADVKDALPENFNEARFVQNSLAFINTKKGRELMQTHGSQVVPNLLKGAYLGLDFLNKECYLVPFKEELNFMIDYRGAKKLAKTYSIRDIEEISAEIVRKNDNFRYWNEDGKPRFTFEPNLTMTNADIVGAFAYVRFKDGGVLLEYADKKDLDKIKSKSRTSNKGAWKDFPLEMYKKCVIHRLCKGIEIDFEKPKQRELFDNDMAIETDPKKIRENEVDENANQQDFTEVMAQDVEEKPQEEIPQTENTETQKEQVQNEV